MNTSSNILNNAKLTKTFGRSKATFIKSLHFWINKAETEMNSIGIVHENRRWIYNTAEEWGEKIGYSERQIQRIISDLIKDNIIYVEKLGRYKKTNTNFYTLNYEKLAELDISVSSFQKKAQGSLKKIISEITFPNTSCRETNPQNITKPTNTTVQDMHAIWNSMFPNNQAIMTKDLGRYLYSAYKNNFNRKMDEWKLYCTVLLAQNPAGIYIETAIQFNTINHYKNTQNQVSTKLYQEKISQDVKPSVMSNQRPESEIDTSKSQEMLDIWNRIFEKKTTYSMNPNIQLLLGQSLKESFNSSLEEWRCHCLSIQSSSWIMSSEFKLHLSWAIKKEVVDKIRAKEWGIKEIFAPKISHTDIVETHIAKMALNEDSFLNKIRRVFIKIYGEAAYRSWIIPVDLKIENRQLVIISDKPLMREYPKEKYPEIFKYVQNNAPSNSSRQKKINAPSLSKNKSKDICTRHKKIPGHYIPHDLRQRFTIDDKGYNIKVNTILKYPFINQNPVTQNDQNNVMNGMRDSLNQQTQREITHPEEEGRGKSAIITKDTLLNRMEQDRLPEHNMNQTIKDMPPEVTIDINPALSTTETQYMDSNLASIILSLNNESPHEKKQLDINISPKNVVKGRGALRHFVASYNTVITNQQNNNLIKPIGSLNHQLVFSSSLDKSNYQVKYYYLKNIMLQEKFLLNISQNQLISNIYVFSKNENWIEYSIHKLENITINYLNNYQFYNRVGEFNKNKNVDILHGWYLNSKINSKNIWKKYTQLQVIILNKLFMRTIILESANTNRDENSGKILQDTG